MREPIPDLALRASERLRRLSTKVIERRPLSGERLEFELERLADPAVLDAIDAKLKAMVHQNSRIIYQFIPTDVAAYEQLAEAFDARPNRNTIGNEIQPHDGARQSARALCRI